MYNSKKTGLSWCFYEVNNYHMKTLLSILFVLAISFGIQAQRYAGSGVLLPALEKEENTAYSASDKNLVAKANQDVKTGKPRPFYFVVDIFEKRADAQELVRELHKQGLEADIKQSSLSGSYYYVHLPKFKSDKITNERIIELRKEFNTAWFQHIE